jgi:hypothetical protein
MIHTVSGTRYMYDGKLMTDEMQSLFQKKEVSLDGEKLYVFDQMIGPKGDVVTRPVRFDNTPFAPSGKVNISFVESWWALSEKSDLYLKFQDLKAMSSAKKAGIVLT